MCSSDLRKLKKVDLKSKQVGKLRPAGHLDCICGGGTSEEAGQAEALGLASS